MAANRVISRSVLGDQVKDRLLEAILSGEYPPDSRIVETQVARELGTSQAPVREALRGLEALGVVEITPFRGARVRRPTASELIEAYAVRSALEALGARLGVPRMTDADLDDLSGLFSQMQDAAAVGDGHAVAAADADFHGRILAMAGNATLERVWRSLEPYSRTYITLIVPGAHPEWTLSLHAPILEALRARDADALVTALEGHFDQAAERLASQWPEELPHRRSRALPPTKLRTARRPGARRTAGRRGASTA
jgi:DNA-binding GntR family transcriptional regulator